MRSREIITWTAPGIAVATVATVAQGGRHPPGHPRGRFTEPVRLSKPLERWPFSRTYIEATGEPRPAGEPPHLFWRAADYTRDNPAWGSDWNGLTLNRPGLS